MSNPWRDAKIYSDNIVKNGCDIGSCFVTVMRARNATGFFPIERMTDYIPGKVTWDILVVGGAAGRRTWRKKNAVVCKTHNDIFIQIQELEMLGDVIEQEATDNYCEENGGWL